MQFTKMHGLGNDFIMLQGPVEITAEQAAQLCNRHFGIGADGLIVVTNNGGQVVMDYWNADGSVAEMCGNGLRCTVRYAVENKLTEPGEFTIKTKAGTLVAKWDGKDSDNIEVQVGKVQIKRQPVDIKARTFYEANVGNPHAITFVDDVKTAPVTTLGPQIENDKHFPNKTNVEFVQVQSKTKLDMRVWERGVGETLACATGMVSSAGVAVELRKAEFPLTMSAPGGAAEIWIDDTGYTRLRGPSKISFAGEIAI